MNAIRVGSCCRHGWFTTYVADSGRGGMRRRRGGKGNDSFGSAVKVETSFHHGCYTTSITFCMRSDRGNLRKKRVERQITCSGVQSRFSFAFVMGGVTSMSPTTLAEEIHVGGRKKGIELLVKAVKVGISSRHGWHTAFII